MDGLSALIADLFTISYLVTKYNKCVQIYKVQQISLQNLIRISMKKLKLERSNSNINSHSQKRHSLNQEPLFVPYKIDWRPVSPSNVENHSNSKVFFQNMKAELSTIKNDFQKLIRREINLKLDNDQPLKPSNTNKLKSYSTSRKESKVQNMPREGLRYGKDQEEQLNRILNLQKNLPCSSKIDLKQTLAKSLQLRDRAMTSAFQAVQIGVHQKAKQRKKSEQESKIQTEKIEQLHKELQKNLAKMQKFEQQKAELRKKMTKKDLVIQNSANQLQKKSHIIQQLQEQITNIKTSFNILLNQKDNYLTENQNLINQRNNLHHHLSELSFHHNQLNIAYNGLIGEHNQQNQSFINLQRFCEDLQRRCADIEADGRRKIEYLQKDIQEYQKREDMFGRQIQNLKIELKQKPSVIYPTQFAQNLVNEQIERLKNEVFHLNRQIEIEKQLHQNLSNKCIEQISNTNNMQQITKNFQEKVSNLLDENTKLKSKVNLVQAKLQSITLQNKSYLEEIRLYEERQKFQMNRKQITTNQWEELTEEIQRLKTQNNKLQLQIENSQKSTSSQRIKQNQDQCQKLLKLSYQQRIQIEELKQNLKAFSIQNEKLKKEVINEAKKYSLFSSENPIQALKNELNHRQQINYKLKQVLFEFVLSKIGLKQEYQQSDYYISKLEQLKREAL